MEPDSSSDKMTGVSSNSGVQEIGLHLSNGLEATTELAAVQDHPTIPGSVEPPETKCDSISSDTLCLTAAPQKPAENGTDLSGKTKEITYLESTHCLQNSPKGSAELSSGNSATKGTSINQDSKDCANRSCVFQDNSVSKDVTNVQNDFCAEVKTPFQLPKTKGKSSGTEDKEEELYVESIAEAIKFKIIKKYFGDTRNPGVLHRLHHKRNYGSFKCRECYLSFHYRPSLIFHKYTHRNKHHLYECSKCSYKSSAPGAYMQHELQHHPDHLYQCEVCNIAFLQRSTLTRHNAVNHHSMTEEQSSSHLCSTTMADKTAAQSKMTYNIPDQPEAIHGMASQKTKTPKPNSNTQQQSEYRKEQIKCKFCKQVFPLKGVEYTHHLQQTDKGVSSAKTSCPWCSFLGNSTCHLTQHKQKIHLCCLLCNKKYSHKDLLRQHIKSFHRRLVKSTGMVKARSRPKAFGKKQQPALCMSSETSRQHMEDRRDQHKNLPNNKEVVQHWYCMTCKVIFPTKRLLDLHIKLNHRPMKEAIEGRQEQENDEMGQWRCLLCNTLHETLRECDKHLLRIHPDEYEYCPRDEIAEPTLSVHVLPESEPPYTCNMCDCKVTSSELLHKHKEEFHKVAYSISITEDLNAKQRSYRCRYRCGYTDCLYMNITKHEVYCAQKVPLTSKILPSAVLDTSTGKLITKYPEVLEPDTDLHQSHGHPVTEQQASLTGMLNISETQEVSFKSDQNVNKMQQASVDEVQSASVKQDQIIVGMELPPQPSSKNLNSKEQLSKSHMHTFNDRQQLPENCMHNENKSQQSSNSSMQNESKTQQTTNGSIQNENKTLQTSNSSMQNENKTLQTSNSSMQNENKTLQTSNSSMQNENKTQQTSNSSMQNENETLQTSNSSMQNENKTQQTSNSSMQNENKTQQTSNSSMQNENKTQQTSESSMQNVNKTLQTSNSSMQNENETQQTSNSSMQNVNETRQTSNSSMQNVNETQQTSNSSMQNETQQTSATCISMENENKMLKSAPSSIHKLKGKTQYELLYEKQAVIKTTSIDRPQVIKTFSGKAFQDLRKSFPNSQQPVQSTIPTDQRWNLTSSNAAKITAHKNPTIIVLPTGSGKKTPNSTSTVYPKKDKLTVYHRRDEISSSSDDDSDCSWLDKSSCSDDENEDEHGDLSPVFPSSDEEVQEFVPIQTIQSANKNKLVNPGTSSTRTVTSCPPLLQPTVLMRFFQAIDMSDLYRLALQMITGSPQPHTLPTSDPLMDAVKTTSFKYKIPMGYSHKEFYDMPLFPSSPEVMRIDYMQTLPSKLVSKHYKSVVAKPQVSLLTSLVDSAVLNHVKGNVLKGVERFVRKQRVEDRKDITLSLSQYIVSQYFKNQEKKGSSQNPLNFSLGTGSGNSPGAGPSCVKTKPSLNKTAAYKSPSNRPSPSSTHKVEVNKPAVYGVTKAMINGPQKQSNIQHSPQQTEIKKSSNVKRKTNVSCSNREKEATVTNKSKNVQGRSPEVGTSEKKDDKSEKKDGKSIQKAAACRETENRKAVASLKVQKSPKNPKSVRIESIPLRRSSRLLRTLGQQCDNNSEAIAVATCDGQKPAGKRTSSNEQKEHKGQEKKRKMYKQTCINESEIDNESKNDPESCQKDNQDDSKPQTVLKAKTRCNESQQPGRNSSNSDQNPPKSSPPSSQTTSVTKVVTATGNLNRAETTNLNHALQQYSSYDAHHDKHNAMLHVAPETILPEIYLDTKVQHTSTETNTVERNGILQMTRHPFHSLNRGTMQIHIGTNAELHVYPNSKTYLKHTGTLNVENVNSPARSKLMESVATQNGVKTRGAGPRVDPSLQPDDTRVKKPLICKWNEVIENSLKPLLYKKPQTCISNPENQHGLRNWAGHTWKRTVSKAEVLELMTKRKTWKCAPYKIETLNTQESRKAMETKTKLVSNGISVCQDKTDSSEKVMNHNTLINILDVWDSTASQRSSHEDCSFRNGTRSNTSEDGKECGQCTKDEMSDESSKGERMEFEVGSSNAEIETTKGEHDGLDSKPLQGSHNMIITGSKNLCKVTSEQEDNGVHKQIIRRRSVRNLQLKRKADTDPKDDQKKQNCTVDHSYIKSPKLECKKKSSCKKSKIGYQLRNRCGGMAGLGHTGVGMQTNEKRLKVPHDHCYISTKEPKTTAIGTDKTDHCYYWKTQNAQKTIQEDNRAHKHEDTSLTQCDKEQTQKPRTRHQDRICEDTHSQAQDHSYSFKCQQEQKAAMDHCYVKITPLVYMDNTRCQDVIPNPSSVNAEPDTVQAPGQAGFSQVLGRSRGDVGTLNSCDEMPDRRVLRPPKKGYQH